MWIKKPDAPQAPNPEQKKMQANQPPQPAKTTLQRAAHMSTEAARLGPNLQVKGGISGSEDLLIEGSVEGLVELAGRKLTIGTTAKVTADIVAGEVVVCGNVKGNVRAKDRIEIKKDGSVTGDLITAQIMIEDGAYFKGSIEIERNVENSADKQVFPQTALH
jgi:cytoskeletal protein CcmA (bactofilin family)